MEEFVKEKDSRAWLDSRWPLVRVLGLASKVWTDHFIARTDNLINVLSSRFISAWRRNFIQRIFMWKNFIPIWRGTLHWKYNWETQWSMLNFPGQGIFHTRLHQFGRDGPTWVTQSCWAKHQSLGWPTWHLFQAELIFMLHHKGDRLNWIRSKAQ